MTSRLTTDADPGDPTATPEREDLEPATGVDVERGDRRRFLLVAGTATGLVTAVLIALSVRAADGHLVYVLDDPAIHMSMARQLSQHGTWGVVAGAYEPASSSPLWTAILALGAWIAPSSLNVLPLVLNLVGAAVVLWIFASFQTFVVPRRGAPMSYIATALMPTALFFLPGLAMVGMEHTVHAALVLGIVVMLTRLETTDLRLRAIAPFLLVVFIAGTVRFETIFVAAGCAAAVLLRSTARFGSEAIRARWSRLATLRFAILTVGVAGLPLLVYGAVNKLFDRSFLPNSIASKAAISQRGTFRSPGRVFEALEQDTVLVVMLFLLVGYIAWAWASGRGDHVLVATTFVVTVLAHGMWGDIGWWDRYQAYLVIFGTFVLCQVASQVAVGVSWRPALLVFTLALLAMSTSRIGLTLSTPQAASNTYRQRYQLGKFFEREYRGQGVATGEIGYVTLFHDGPVLDLLGLSSHEVTQALRDHDGNVPADDVAALFEKYDVRAIGMYPSTGSVAEMPKAVWPTARWTLHEDTVSTIEDSLDFSVPRRAESKELLRKLRRFEPELPARVEVLERDDLLRKFLGGG